MSVNKPKLLTGRVPVVDYANLSADRYQFLGLGQAEPNLGPGEDGSVLTISTNNTRVWATAISLTGNISANYYFGNGSQLTGVTATSSYANALIGDTLSGNVLFSSLTTLGTLSELSVTGTVSVLGNILTVGDISTTGNITANYYFGNGSQLTGVTATSAWANSLIGDTLSSNVLFSSLTSVGILANLSVAGNIDANNISTSNIISAAGNIFGGGIRSTSSPVAPSNPSVGDFWYDTTTNVQYRFTFDGTSYYWVDDYGSTVGTTGTFSVLINGNSNVSVFNNGNIIATVGGVANVVTWAPTGEYVNGVISASGNIYTAGQVSATGNIVVSPTGFFIGNLIGNTIGCIAVPGANTQVLYNNEGNVGASPGFTFDSATNIATITGDIQGGNFLTAGQASAAGNVTGGNIYTVGEVSATANVTGDYFIGNGSQLTGITITDVDAGTLIGNTLSSNVIYSSLTTVGTLTSLSVSGSTTAGNLLTPGIISSTGNITTQGNLTGNNLTTAGLISAVGNVTGNYIIGNGSQLTGVTATTAYANALIGNTLSGNVLFSSLTTVGTLTNLSVAGNTLTVGFISAGGNVTGGNILTVGLISATSTITSAANIRGGNLLTVGLISATSTITSAANVRGGNLLTAGLISVTGNAIAGNISTAGLITATGNITVGNLLTAGLISATSTITSAANIIGGNILTAGQMSSTGNAAHGNILTSGQVSATGNLNGGGLAVNGNATIIGNLQVQGNVTFIGSNIITTNDLYIALANNQSTSANINNAGLEVGNIAGTPIVTWLYNHATTSWQSNVGITPSSNSSVDLGGPSNYWANTYIDNVVSNVINSAGDITGNNILTGGIVSAVGNIITDNYVLGNAYYMTGINAAVSVQKIVNGNSYANIASPDSDFVIAVGVNANVVATFYDTGVNFIGLVSTTGDVVGNNVSATSNVIGGNITTAGIISSTGNVIGGNINTVGNVSGNYIIGNGSQLTGIVSSSNFYANALIGNTLSSNVLFSNLTSVGTLANLSVSGNVNGGNIRTSGLVTASGNVIGGNIRTNGLITSTGNVLAGNILTAGFVSATGNVTGNYVIGNGSLLTGVASGLANALVGNTLSSNVLFSSLTTVGTLANLSVSGNVNGGNIRTTGLITASGNVVGGNILTGGEISSVSNITVGPSSFFVGNLVGNVTGNISGNLVAPGANTQVLYNSDGVVAASAGFTFDQSSNALISTGTITGSNFLTGGLISAVGNITGNYFVGNGSRLSSITGANVIGSVANAAYANTSGTTGTVTTNAQPNITSVGTLTSLSVSGNTISNNILVNNVISATGNIITAGYFVGTFAGSISGNVTAPGLNTQVIYNDNGNLAGSGGFTFTQGTNALVSTGTITGSNFLTGGLVSAAGNITGSRFIGSGNSLSNITGANVTGAVANATYANTSGVTGTVTTNAQPNITSVGTLTTLTVSGNTTSNNISVTNFISATGNIITSGFFIGAFAGSISGNVTAPGANTQVIYNNNGNLAGSAGFTFDQSSNALAATGTITGSNFLTGGLISATGNITGNYIVGNGSHLSSITGANVVGAVANATYANTATTASTVTANAQANITSVGILTSLSVSGDTTGNNISVGNIISATGNIITAGNFIGNLIGNIVGNIAITGSNTQVLYNYQGNVGASAGFTFNQASNALIVTGNVTGANLLTSGSISAAGNINAANIISTNYNGTTISASGTITAGQFVGNGNTISNIQGANVSGDVTSAITANTVTANAQANITSVGTLTSLTISGNTNTSNVLNSGQISAGGNITTNAYFIGNFLGNISGNLTVPGSNTQVIFNNSGNAGASAGFTFDSAVNVATITGNTIVGNLRTAGQITATGNILGGNILAINLVNAASHTGAAVSVTGNITGSRFIGSGNSLSNITGANVTGQVSNALIAGTVYTNAQPNITSVGTLTSLAVTSNITSGNLLTGGIISASGNVTSNAYFIGNFLGNITGNLTVPGSNTQVLYNDNGNAGASSGLTFNAASNLLVVGGTISSTGNVLAANIFSAAVISSVGNIVSAANIIAGGNAPTGAALNGIGLVAGNNAGVPFATFVYNSITQGWMSNVSIAPAANTTLNLGTSGNWWNNFYAFNITSSTISANANISGGNLLTIGVVSATGNITTAGYFVGNFAGNITGNLSVPGSNTQVIYNNNGNAGASTGFTFNQASNAAVIAGNITGANILTIGLMSSTGNAIHGNVSTGGQVSAGANITGANLLTGGQVSATGNITTSGNFIGNLIGNITGNFTVPGANTQIIYNNNGNAGASAALTFNSATNALTTTGTVSATGNITANYFIGNGSQLTGITVAATFPVANGTSNVNAAVNANVTVGVGGTANVAVFASTGEYVSGIVSASGNVIGANILTGGLMSSTGNAIHGNVLTAGLISATSTITSAANITGANILTAGLMSSTGNAIHGNVLTAGLVSATGNITTGGYFLGIFAGSISGNVTAPGTNTQVVYNNSGNLAGSSNFTFNQATNVLSVSTGTISVGNIVNSNGNGVGNIGNASSYFNTVFAQATSAVYADLAEMYAADSNYVPGTVVEFGGQNEITASSTDHSILVAGIISTNPSYLMNSAQAGEHVLPVALTGRAPCCVVGKIRRGDRLTTSSIVGVATALDITKYQPGCIIGKALEDYDSNKIGIIEIAVGRF